jgi:hypothetical protein
VGRVIDLLTTKIPDVQPHIPMIMQAEWPFCDLDTIGLFLIRVELVVYKSLDNRGLAYCTAPHQNELGFVQWPSATPPRK